MQQDDGIELFNLTKRVSANPEQIFSMAEQEFGFITMDLISKMRIENREKIVEELGVYSRMIDDLSDEEEDESETMADESSGGLFVPYVPSQMDREEKKQTLGNHRTVSNSSDSDSEARRSVAAQIQKKWNHSVNSLLPKVRGHRRLHSDGRVFLRSRKPSRSRSAYMDIDPPIVNFDAQVALPDTLSS
mmetsp:Transcript_10234/g.12629  ORF Transcript_10234/g.12629 Transcript_10234/m.12629 type:complete len:189 (-) Transcript_10234:37-603(-)